MLFNYSKTIKLMLFRDGLIRKYSVCPTLGLPVNFCTCFIKIIIIVKVEKW